MKKLLPAFLLLTLTLNSNGQSGRICIGKIDTVHSKVLNEKRAIWIYTPDRGTPADSSEKFPVVYLLDGDWHFVSVAGILQQLSYVNGNTIIPEMMIVGIPISDRYRDLTPSKDSSINTESGCYDRFIEFISSELIPYIETAYRTAPYRVFIGHSLGGLAVMHTLARTPDLFNAYVAIDPSMWWDNRYSLRVLEKAISARKFDGISVFLAIANTLDKGMDTVYVRTDGTRNTLPIRSNLELSDLLNSNPNHHLHYQVTYYQNENHGSVPLIATYDALHFLFDFYNLPLTKKDYADTSMMLANLIENHYNIVSERMGYRINPSENTINALGYNALYLKNLKLAEYFFKLNIRNYPRSCNAFDSMGDFFMAIDDIPQARLMYEKALLICENPETRQKYRKISGN